MLNDPTVDQQLLRATPASLSVTLLDSTGEPRAAAGTVTVHVTRADGSDLLAAGSSTVVDSDDSTIYTAALTAAQTAQLDILTAVWTDNGVAVATTLHEIVGGFYFTIAEARQLEPSLRDLAKYPNADVLEFRREVEEEFETIAGVAFVPRYAHIRISGTGTESIELPDGVTRLRTVRSVRTYFSATDYIDATSDQLAALQPSEWGELDWLVSPIDPAAGLIFAYGQRNIVLGVEHGYDRPPATVKRAGVRRLRQRLNGAKSAFPENAQRFTAENGATYTLARPTVFSTGDDEIDAVLGRFATRIPGIA